MSQNREQLEDSFRFWQDSVAYHQRDARSDFKKSNICTMLGTAGVAFATHNQVIGVPAAAIGFGLAAQFHRSGGTAISQALSCQRKTDLIEQQLSQKPIS